MPRSHLDAVPEVAAAGDRLRHGRAIAYPVDVPLEADALTLCVRSSPGPPDRVGLSEVSG
jgi:hypothetical protein